MQGYERENMLERNINNMPSKGSFYIGKGQIDCSAEIVPNFESKYIYIQIFGFCSSLCLFAIPSVIGFLPLSTFHRSVCRLQNSCTL